MKTGESSDGGSEDDLRHESRDIEIGAKGWSYDRRRDRLLLAKIAAARADGDGLGAVTAIGELLDLYRHGVRTRIAWRLRVAVEDYEVDDVTAAVMERLVRALSTKSALELAPFGAIVMRSIEWEAAEFWRQRARRDAVEELKAPSEMPERVRDAASLIEQIDAVRPVLGILAPRERAIVVERVFLGMDAKHVAERHGIRPAAVDKAFSRARSKLRGHSER